MTWIALAAAWLGLTSVFLVDGPLLIATFGHEMSPGVKQLYLAVPLAFGPLVLLLTPWRWYVAAVAVAVAGLHWAGHLLWVRSLRLAPRFDGVFVGPAGLGPAVVGLWRPVLVLPPEALELPEEELHVVLAHERAHVAARDSLKLWLAGVVRTLLCWHPLARLDLDALRLAIELQADARAVAALGGDARRYALILGRLALTTGGRTPAWGAALAERPAELTVRLQALTEPGPPIRELRLPAWIVRRFPPHRRGLQGRRLMRYGVHLLLALVMGGYLGLFLLVNYLIQ